MRALRRLCLFVVVLVAAGSLLVGASSPVVRHLKLTKAEPGLDSTITEAPGSVNLYFTNAPQARGSAIMLLNEAGEEVVLEDAVQDAENGKIIRAKVTGVIAPGSYDVAWRTMARDGHVVRGEYRFTFQPPNS